MEISKEDLDVLLGIMKDDPEFVGQYLGENDYYFSVRQCAKVLNVCPNTILYRIKNENIKAERNKDGNWKIKAKDLQAYLQNKQEERPEVKKIIMQSKIHRYKYDKSTSQNVLDFLHNWEKSNIIGFSTKTLTEDFNKVCATKTTEGQMGGILATLTKKKILVRKGRGIYAIVDGFKVDGQSKQAIPAVRVEETEPESTIVEKNYRSNLGKNLEDILKLNVSDDLKAKIIREIMA